MASIAQLLKVGSHQGKQLPALLFVSSRNYSTELGNFSLVDYKRGRGGRSSFSGVVATVFGGSGFLARYVVARLGRDGSQIIIPHRGDSYHVQRLKVCGDLGQVQFTPYHLNDEESLRKTMKYSNVVINLVGRDFETWNFKFNDVHVDGARRIARIAREMGVKRLIHMSSLNADKNPQKVIIPGGSKFLKSKKLGEEAVLEEFPEATIFRPADMFGSEDRFMRYYASWWRKSGRYIPLWKKGEMTIKQPVYVGDVAEGIMTAIRDPETAGKIYECVGPNRYYLCDLVDYICDVIRMRHHRRSPLHPFFLAKVFMMSFAPSTPIFTLEKMDREHVTDKTTGLPTLEDLGVKLEAIENRAAYDLKQLRHNAYYAETLGEFEDPKKPDIVTTH